MSLTEDDMEILCYYCEKNEKECECMDSPLCPKCEDDFAVVCSECGNAWLACDCATADLTDFFCQACSHDFQWDPIYHWDDDAKQASMIPDDVDVEPVFDRPTEADQIALEFPDQFPTKHVEGIGNLIQVDDVWYWPDGQELKCYCFNEKQYRCVICKVIRKTYTSPWEYDAPDKASTNYTGSSTGVYPAKGDTTPGGGKIISQPGRGYSGSYKNVQGKSGKTTYITGGKKYTPNDDDDYEGWWAQAGGGFCRHYHEPVKLNSVIVYASSMNDKPTRKDPPDFGLYADWGWRPWWRNEHIDWPDMNLPEDFQTAYEQISEAFARVQRDAAFVIEAGCIGGHGRTGVILSCWAVLDGMTAKEALAHVRKVYCHQAAETLEQEWWVEWFEAKFKGVEAPAKPVRKYSAGISTSTHACSRKAHWDMWLSGKDKCTLKPTTCSFYKMDLEAFTSGKFEIKDGQPVLSGSPANTSNYVGGDNTIIDGYKIPRPRPGQPQHWQCETTRLGPSCDYCRYVALRPRGIGEAFLEKTEPIVVKGKDEEGEFVNVTTHNGEIIKVRVDIKEPEPHIEPVGTPRNPMVPRIGDKKAGFTYKGIDEGWVADMDAPKSKRSNRRNKKKGKKQRTQKWHTLEKVKA